ncbi:hypothetical protein [Staphylococcus phage vB_ScaM-V1SC04]|nr:hypothetical protein [Staphylococcus phage vB_ScaM-V1SC04]
MFILHVTSLISKFRISIHHFYKWLCISLLLSVQRLS